MNNRETSSAPLPKPTLLKCAMIFFACFAALSMMIMPAALLGPGSTYKINGDPVSRSDFFARTGLLIYSFPLIAIYVGLIAYALYDDQTWSRTLLVAYLPVLGVFEILASFQLAQTVSGEQIGFDAFIAAILSIVGWWYLYRKRYVVEYYRSIGGAPRR